jgi:ATP-dependent protease ClpP protease subunit
MASKDKGDARTRRRHESRKRAKILPLNVASGDLLIFGEIGDEYSESGVTVKRVNDAILAVGSQDPITVRINSGGGDAFAGVAIYNMLVQHPARIIVNIEGAALSAASVIAMAGDEIKMAENAIFMIHDPRMWAGGVSTDMRKAADLLDKVAGQIRDTYVARTGLDADKVEKLMAAETWLDAEEAFELGFITEIVEAKQVAAQFDPSVFNSVPGRFAKLVAQAVTGVESESTNNEEDDMNPELKKLFVSLGMDEKLSDADAIAWATKNLATILDESKRTPSIDVAAVLAAIKPADNTAFIVDTVTNLIEDREAKRAAARKAFTDEVDANLELAFGAEIPQDIRAQCYAASDLAAARAVIKDARAKQSADLQIRFAPSQPRDEHLADVRTAFVMRAMHSAGCTQASIDREIPIASRGKRWQDFQDVSLLTLCRQCLLIDGYGERAVSRLSNPDIAKAAFGFVKSTSLRNEAGLATHVTGSLAEITRDAVNKSLLAGYTEAPQTWRGPMRQAASVPDFKTIHRVRLGAVSNLPIWPDSTIPESAQLNDEKVSYAVEARAEKVSFSWQLFCNDDMDALSRVPRLMGDAAARTVNATAWAQVTSNPTMPYDSIALFAAASGGRKRTNLATGSASPTTSTLAAMTTLMRLMRGINTPEGAESQDILNLTPKYLICPATLEVTCKQLVYSSAEPAATYNSGVYNPNSYLTLVVEPLLDASSTTAWYLFADPSRVDTIEVSFLQGQETPVTNDWIDQETWSRCFTIVQTFAAKAIDHRGVQKHAGA